MIKQVFQLLSFVVLLCVSSIFGFLQLQTEMGLSILAGALGLAFSNLDRISRFKGAGFEAEMNMVHTMIENQTEPSPEVRKEAKFKATISADENSILKSLQHRNYAWRYAQTVAGEGSLSVKNTEELLKSMMAKGYVRSGKGSKGEIWTITTLGKSVQEQHTIKNS